MVVIRGRWSLHKHFSREYTHVRYLGRTKVKIIHLVKQAFSHKCTRKRIYENNAIIFACTTQIRCDPCNKAPPSITEWERKKRQGKSEKREKEIE